MATGPIHPGLGELGQRLQALSDPAAEPPRLRPYQGSSQPAAPAAAPAERPAYSDWRPIPPAPPQPFPTPDAAKSANGFNHIPGTSQSEVSAGGAQAAPAASAPPTPG
ncbi:MAG TPA: hypothetical protein VL346_12990, partial [Acidobacteriaceae bacterium]|nr:hypothetical protein [Acidobacteriaceae bacterium]